MSEERWNIASEQTGIITDQLSHKVILSKSSNPEPEDGEAFKRYCSKIIWQGETAITTEFILSKNGDKFLLSGGMSKLDEFEGELPSNIDFIVTNYERKFHDNPTINIPINHITQFQLNGIKTDNQYWELYVGNKKLDLYHPSRRGGIDCGLRLIDQSSRGFRRGVYNLRRQLTR